MQARAPVLRVLSVFSSEYIYRREKESGVSSETENKMVEIDRGDPFDCGGLSDWYVAEHEEDDGEYQRCGKETYTPQLLDGLKERGVKASFFVIGKEAEEHPELILRMYKEGHLIGNHTYHHVELTRVDMETEKEEIKKTNEVIEGITGEKVTYIRPPYGELREETLKDVELIPVKWDIDPLDWCTKSTGEIVRKVVTRAEENGIILLHDCYGTSVEAGLQIIDALQKEGYQFVTVDELIMD